MFNSIELTIWYTYICTLHAALQAPACSKYTASDPPPQSSIHPSIHSLQVNLEILRRLITQYHIGNITIISVFFHSLSILHIEVSHHLH